MRPPLLYNVVAALSWPVLYGLFRLRVKGRENVPADGGYILRDAEAANVLLMVEGKSAPQPPAAGSLFGSGCSNKVLG